MARFVDLDDDDVDPPQNSGKPVWNGLLPHRSVDAASSAEEGKAVVGHSSMEVLNPNHSAATEALGCYPIVMSVAACIDLNTLDNLSRTCRSIRQGLLQYRKMLLVSTQHCCNEDVPVDREDTLRYRARAGNWFYMQDISRTNYNGKSGECARDLVSECRRCGTVVCRNCAIKPPAPIVLRDRHRRLCSTCTKAPLGRLVKPNLPADALVDSEPMQQAICKCNTEGVWLCQPCGRTIRSDDYDYKGIWRWRNQYGEVLGGLGTGIGDADRGVICGRESRCLGARDREQETDCDAEDAREAESYSSSPPSSIHGGAGPPSTTTTASIAGSLHSLHSGAGGSEFGSSLGAAYSPPSGHRTPSPLPPGPGYARHEIEGIGGVVKTKLVRMVRVGACVSEWEDEKAKGEILGREVRGEVRSWCGWCWRVIPGKKDYDAARERRREREAQMAEGPS